MEAYYPLFVTIAVVVLSLLGITVALVVPGFMLSARSQKSGSSKSAATSTEPAVSAAKAAEPEKKKEEKKKEAKEKKLELAFSYWLFLFLFIAAAFIIPPFMAGGLGSTDTWLLVLLSSLAATFVVSTGINYFFEFDETITKINKVVVVGLIAGFAFLLWQNGFSTTSALKDASALASKPFGDINLNLPQRSEASRTVSGNGRTTSVLIPACSTGWSQVVQIPVGQGMDWSWTVQAEYTYNGSDWTPHVPYSSPNADAFRYCSNDTQHVGKEMPITWR